MILEQLVLHMQKNEVRYLPGNTYKNWLKIDKALSVKAKNMKLSEGKRQKSLCSWIRQFLLYMNPNTQKTKIGVHWNWKDFCIKEMTLSRVKREPTVWDKIFTYYISNKGIQSRIYTEFLYLKTKQKQKTVKNEKILYWIDISPKKIC